MINWTGWNKHDYAKKLAKFGFPSNIVPTSGSPKASVLCEAPNMAAMTSPRENFQKG
jgi:hypothetical protein